MKKSDEDYKIHSKRYKLSKSIGNTRRDKYV